MITMTYECDRCGHKQDTPNSPRSMFETMVQLKPAGMQYGAYGRAIHPAPTLCSECLDKLQINVQPKPEEKALTLQEKLAGVLGEVIAEEVQEALSNA